VKSAAIQRAAATILLLAMEPFAGQTSLPAGNRFENQYLTIAVQTGWTVHESADQTLNLTHGKICPVHQSDVYTRERSDVWKILGNYPRNAERRCGDG
jgi:hypothetical protein